MVVGGEISIILRSGGLGNILTLGSAIIASVAFYKPFVIIPPLQEKRQRASAYEAMALMSFGTNQYSSTLSADCPDLCNLISHVPDRSQHWSDFQSSFKEKWLSTVMHCEGKYISFLSSRRHGGPQSGRSSAR